MHITFNPLFFFIKMLKFSEMNFLITSQGLTHELIVLQLQ